jgi:hypothetical protein
MSSRSDRAIRFLFAVRDCWPNVLEPDRIRRLRPVSVWRLRSQGRTCLASSRIRPERHLALDGPEVVRPLPRGTPDWSAAYAYTRWRPSVFTSVSRESVCSRGQRLGRLTHVSRCRRLSTKCRPGSLSPSCTCVAARKPLASLVRTATRYQLPDRGSRSQPGLVAHWRSRTIHRSATATPSAVNMG